MSNIEGNLRFGRQRLRWMNPGVVRRWSQEGGGISLDDRELVGTRLIDTGFYHGLTSKSSILDLGVGVQTYLNSVFIPKGSKVHAADISQTMVDALKAKQAQEGVQLYTDFHVMDAASLHFPKNSFDRIFSPFMIRYILESEQVDAIYGMIAATKDTGRIDIMDFNTIHYPGQESEFQPFDLEKALGAPSFQERLAALGKEVKISSSEVPLYLPTATRLYHMQLNVRAS